MAFYRKSSGFSNAVKILVLSSVVPEKRSLRSERDSRQRALDCFGAGLNINDATVRGR